ncbi:hypothetical protein P8452_01938 [Trifolium repens]|nr:hypothetical protein P8452_01938 [Trifolium repens]
MIHDIQNQKSFLLQSSWRAIPQTEIIIKFIFFFNSIRLLSIFFAFCQLRDILVASVHRPRIGWDFPFYWIWPVLLGGSSKLVGKTVSSYIITDNR